MGAPFLLGKIDPVKFPIFVFLKEFLLKGKNLHSTRHGTEKPFLVHRVFGKTDLPYPKIQIVLHNSR